MDINHTLWSDDLVVLMSSYLQSKISVRWFTILPSLVVIGVIKVEMSHKR